LDGNNGQAVGVVVPVRDEAALKTALDELLRSPAKRRALGTAARRKCETTYADLTVFRQLTEQWAMLAHGSVKRNGRYKSGTGDAQADERGTP
jgi:hypothetical protein